MALSKVINTDFGVDGTYWNIFSVNEDFKNKILDLVVTGYVSQSARLAGAEPIKWITVTLADADYIADATRVMVYEKLKATSFVGATDC